MIYKEEKCDLLSVPADYSLCHCVSADFKMGAGIAKKFTEIGVRDAIINEYGNSWTHVWGDDRGYCIDVDRPNCPKSVIFNLITKQYYWQKPTYNTMRNALTDLKHALIEYHHNIQDLSDEEISKCKLNIDKIAMPKIGCGLDKLKWEKVSEIIKDVFDDMDIEILVCYL